MFESPMHSEPLSFLKEKKVDELPTVDDKIVEFLENLAEKENLAFKHWMVNRTHFFQLGEEIASLDKRLLNAEVGSREAIIRSQFVKQQYDSFPWWKSAIDSTGARFSYV
jgi:hypothetical protein